ncbi:MAG: P1 family peptidase, partial [Acidimicrobiales bacterium]
MTAPAGQPGRPVQPWRCGPTNSLHDVAGLRVGHHHAVGGGWLTGTTVVVGPDQGMTGGVDVRGGGPGTHETDALGLTTATEAVHAVVLGGGSAFGLAAVVGVAESLEADGIGLRVTSQTGTVTVPIVPAAIVFDLGRGGDPACRPDRGFGAAAYRDAREAGGDGRGPAQGCVGAGAGCVAGGLKGGVGSASAVVGDSVVAALAVVNAAGSTVDAATGALYGAGFRLPGELDHLRMPESGELLAAREAGLVGSLAGPLLAGTFLAAPPGAGPPDTTPPAAGSPGPV